MRQARWRASVNLRPLWFLLTALLGVGLAILVIHQLNLRLGPILLELAQTQTANHITAAVDAVVAEQAVAYTDLVTLERTENGDIVALTSNMAHANILRAQLLETALDALSGVEAMDLEVPLGTILDWDIFSGLGPGVDARVVFTGTATAEFENEFSSAGINQTCHQIFFHINADISVLLPGQQLQTTTGTRICVAETIIVGKVPETYLQIAS